MIRRGHELTVGAIGYIRVAFLPVEWGLGVKLLWDGGEGDTFLAVHLGPFYVAVGVDWGTLVSSVDETAPMIGFAAPADEVALVDGKKKFPRIDIS